MPQSLRRTLRKIYAYHALDDFVLLYPFYGVFMADKGLSIFQISTLFILWSVTDLITNVPMGVLADKYSRKNLLGIGQIIKALGFLVWFVFPTYLGFAAGFVLWGIGGALVGGTFEALVYDELRTVNQQGSYIKVMGRARSLALVANLAATALAGAAILLGYGFIYGASVAVALVSSLLVFTLSETKRFEQVVDTRYFSMMRQGVMEAVRNKTIMGLILLGGFIGAAYGSLEEYDSLLIRGAGVAYSTIAPAVAITVAAAALATFVAHKYEKLRASMFMGLLALSGVALLGIGVFSGLGLVIPLVIYTFLIKMLSTIYEGKLQHSIASGLRATITSAGGIALEVLSVVFYLVYGIIAQHRHNLGAFQAFGGLIVVVALLYFLAAPRLLAVNS